MEAKRSKKSNKNKLSPKKQIKNRLNFAKTIIYPIFTTP